MELLKLARLKKLNSLRLYKCKIDDEKAQALVLLKNIEWLDLSDNKISDKGAKILSSMILLTSLDLSSNRVGNMGAQALSSIRNLTSLDLRDNQVSDMGAQVLSSMRSLTSLDLSSNQIGEQGAKIFLDNLLDSPTKHRLTLLSVNNNEGFEALLPTEVLETDDAQSILAAYRRYRGITPQPINEAKLLVVGNEAVGKTSLIRYLIEDEPRDPGEQKTKGINPHERIETQPWSTEDSQVQLNVWDFGGQEIMRGTHRYFLSQRSLYLLVLEDRRQDDESIYDWLKGIQNRGKDSPIIVVINKSDNGKQDLRLNEPELQENYENIVGFLRTSCEDNQWAKDSIQELKKKIADTLLNNKQLKHARDRFPESWLTIKQAIAEKSRDSSVLPLSYFEHLCVNYQSPKCNPEEAITDPNEQRALLRLLHDLGVIVAHGLERDAPAVRRKITILDPNWLTTAIYTILNQPALRDQNGEFSRDQLSSWLDSTDYPVERHEFILNMMMEDDIGLCLPLSSQKPERYLIPEALPKSTPKLDQWPEDSLRFRFRYDFLPSGLIPRFIVQAHRNLSADPKPWHSGLVLDVSQCRVLVRGDLDEEKIDITVDGPKPLQRAALNVVLDYLDAVHALNPETNPQARVPLPDKPTMDVSYKHLLKLEQERGPDYPHYPDGADRDYTIQELLDHVRRDPPRSRDGSTHIHISGGSAYFNTGEGYINAGKSEPAPMAPEPTEGNSERLRQKLVELQEVLDLVNEKLAGARKQRILETKDEEKRRIQLVIDGAKAERDEIEQEMENIEIRLAGLDD